MSPHNGESDGLLSDTPRVVGEAFLRWNDAVGALRDAVADWPTNDVEKARMLDGLDLNHIAALIDKATAAMYLFPGMPEDR